MQVIRIDNDDFTLWSNQIEGLFNSSVKVNFPEADIGDWYGRNKCREVAGFLKGGTAIVFAAVEGEQLAGWVWCHEIHRMNRRIHIAEIAVADKWHRQGIGSQLLKRVELYAEENGYKEIDLFVTASNMSAVKFYGNADYKPERYLMKKIINKDVHAGENVDA